MSQPYARNIHQRDGSGRRLNDPHPRARGEPRGRRRLTDVGEEGEVHGDVPFQEDDSGSGFELEGVE